MGVTFSDDYIAIMTAMLQVDYTQRPTAEEIKDRIKELLED